MSCFSADSIRYVHRAMELFTVTNLLDTPRTIFRAVLSTHSEDLIPKLATFSDLRHNYKLNLYWEVVWELRIWSGVWVKQKRDSVTHNSELCAFIRTVLARSRTIIMFSTIIWQFDVTIMSCWNVCANWGQYCIHKYDKWVLGQHIFQTMGIFSL